MFIFIFIFFNHIFLLNVTLNDAPLAPLSILFLCSAHLRALPDRGLGLRGVRFVGFGGRRVLLPLPPTQTGAQRGRRSSPGVHPHDDLEGLVVASVQHGHVVQLLRPAPSAQDHPGSGSRAHFAHTGLVLPAAGRQRLRQHAHELFGPELPTGYTDHAPPGPVPAPAVHRVRPRGLAPAGLLGSHAGHVQGATVPLPTAHECDQRDESERGTKAGRDFVSGGHRWSIKKGEQDRIPSRGAGYRSGQCIHGVF